MGWIAVFRVPPPQRAPANRLVLEDQQEAGERIPTQATTATIPSAGSQPSST